MALTSESGTSLSYPAVPQYVCSRSIRQLAKGKRLRGTKWDVFGYTSERKLERQMITDYEAPLAESSGG